MAALNSLFQSCRDPRRSLATCADFTLHDYEDFVHGCFAGLLRHDFLKGIGRDKGRFRTFLLTSLKNQVRNELDKVNAA